MGEARVFQALSDRTRLEILSVLAAGTVNVSTIVARLGCSQPAVSRHLRVLREASLIRGARKGKEVEYSIVPEAIRSAAKRLGSLTALMPAGSSSADGPTPTRPHGTIRKRGRSASRGRPRDNAAAPPAVPERDDSTPKASEYRVDRRPSGMDDFLL
jgi:DNA-binding transcriptional ArsR family regulator